MHVSEKSSIDGASFARTWGPGLVRFFFLLCVNQATAEALTFDTLSELIRSRRFTTSELVRLAVAKATKTPFGGEQEHDPVARAVASLPREQGCAVALFKGMNIPVDEIAKVSRTSTSQTKRLIANGLLQLHELLLVNQQDLRSPGVS